MLSNNTNGILDNFFPHHIQEEILEYLFVAFEENFKAVFTKIEKIVHHNDVDLDSILNNLITKDFIQKIEDNYEITEKGKIIGEQVVRRNRLGERLLADVLALQDTDIVETACKFEHILNEGVEEAICTILGHPSYCPHGKRIPKGPCCTNNTRNVDQIVIPLSQLSQGDFGSVRYLKTSSDEEDSILKLVNFGILPGKTIKLISKHPTYIIKIDESTIALEKFFAERIYLRKSTHTMNVL